MQRVRAAELGDLRRMQRVRAAELEDLRRMEEVLGDHNTISMAKAVSCDPVIGADHVFEADQDQVPKAKQADQADQFSAGGHAVDKDRGLRRRRRRRRKGQVSKTIQADQADEILPVSGLSSPALVPALASVEVEENSPITGSSTGGCACFP